MQKDTSLSQAPEVACGISKMSLRGAAPIDILGDDLVNAAVRVHMEDILVF